MNSLAHRPAQPKVRMKSHSLKLTVLAMALGIAFSHIASSSEDAGQRIDNGRVDARALPSPGETQRNFNYPLPSGVTHEEANAMRQANQALPDRPAEKRESFSERLGNGSYFASGSAELTDFARRSLRDFAAPFKGKSGIKLAVVGHTDNQRLSANSRKRYPDNQALSEARAMVVADFLRRDLDIAAADTAISGQGEALPITGNDTPQGMARNRRVELSIWYNQTALLIPAVALPRPPCAPLSGLVPDLPFTVTVDGEPLDIDQKPPASAVPTWRWKKPISRCVSTA